LKVGTVQSARTAAFSVLVFAELFRAFGARSDTKPLWRLSPLVSTNLVLVVFVSVGLQVLSQHNTFLGHVLKSSYLPYLDCLWFFGLGSVPLIVLELVKVIRQRWGKDAAIAVAR
jgi:Ca2+-transporting ATPase